MINASLMRNIILCRRVNRSQNSLNRESYIVGIYNII